jgi:hypothetical protein
LDQAPSNQEAPKVAVIANNLLRFIIITHMYIRIIKMNYQQSLVSIYNKLLSMMRSRQNDLMAYSYHDNYDISIYLMWLGYAIIMIQVFWLITIVEKK